MNKTAKKPITTVALVVVLLMNTVFVHGYERHWYWDQITHFLSGFVLGMVLPTDHERESFLGCAIVWECFEWKLATMKLYELHDSIPEGPRSMGYEKWSMDHQTEDTILDTVMGYYGVQMARRLK